MASLPIGAMRHRLTLEAPVEVPDLAGGVRRSWVAVATVWASIEPREARPSIFGDAPVNLATHRVTIRWRSDVTAANRLVAGNRILAIRAISDPDERRSWLVLTVEETGP
jgi:SPP1 family predicted phage head-tail adaptor